MKKTLLSLITIFSITSSLFSQSVGDYASLATGNWNAPATWGKYTGTAYVSDGTIPAGTEMITVQTGNTVTINVAVTLSGNGYLKNSGVIAVSGGTLTLNGNSTYEHAINGGTIPAATWNTGSTCLISGTVAATSITGAAQNFYNFTYNSPGQTSTLQLSMIPASTSLTTIGGNFTVISTGAGSTPGKTRFVTLAAGDNKTLAVNGNLVISGGTLESTGNGVTGTINININGDMTLETGSNFNMVASSAASILNLNGNLSLNGTAVFTKGSGTGQVNFKKAGVQTFSRSTTSVMTSSGSALAFSVIAGSTLDMGTSILGNSTGTYTFSLNAGGGLRIGDPAGISTSGATGNVQVSGSRSYSTAANYEYSGTAAQLTGTGLTGANNLIITNAGGVTLSNATAVTGTLGFGNVNLSTFAAGTNLTLSSTAASTGRIADITNAGVNTGNAITGNITIERFMPLNTTSPRSGRAWRLLASPLTAATAPTIFNSWQEGGAATSTGTQITQAGGAGTNGYDASTIANASSIRYFDGTNLVTPANTDVTKVTDNGAGYFLFVRGNRNININDAAASSATTLRMTGAVNMGNITMGMSGSAYSLIPNPYPSPVDYEAIIAGNLSLTGTYYVWDANLGTVGGYRTIQRTAANTYQSTPTTGNTTSDNLMRYIISGQSIFVPGAATVNFTEAMKSAIIPTNSVFRTGSAEELTVDLKLANAGNASLLADGVRVKFDNTYSNAIDASDITKNANFTENLAIAKGAATLSIEKRDLVDHADTIFLKLWNTGVKDYEFEITPSAFNAPNLSAYLEDAFTGTSTPLSLTNATQVQFSVTTAAASQNADRFKIVFRTNGVLAVNYTSVKAYQQNTGVQVEWNIATETNIRNYEVEKSTDGRTFATAATITARANNNTSVSYNWYDATPTTGVNYYRIKATENSNAVKVSQVVSVKIGNVKSEISVYPNPVTNNTMSLQFTNEAKGIYTVELFNSIGQQVYAKTIEHQGGSATQTLNLGSTVSKGIYQLQVTNGENKTTQQVVIN